MSRGLPRRTKCRDTKTETVEEKNLTGEGTGGEQVKYPLKYRKEDTCERTEGGSVLNRKEKNTQWTREKHENNIGQNNCVDRENDISSE